MIVGFAGAGNMAAAIARGWHAGDGGPERMVFCDLDASRAEALAGEVSGEVASGLGELRDRCELLVLAVKPVALSAVASELEGRAPALVSVMAATPLAALGAAFPEVPVVRVMPNQPVEVRSGVSCFAFGEGVSPDLRQTVVALLETIGLAFEMPEADLEAAMAVMSCAPAYVALTAQALADAGAAEGLAPELALELVAATLKGTAELLARRGPEEIRRAVAPPGGATEAGLAALERAGLSEAFGDAVRASLERFR